MEIEKEINKRKELQSLILNFIDKDDDDDNFRSLTKFINNNNISKTRIDLQDFLNLLTKIADNYYRGINFFSKIMKVINFLLPDIRSSYKDREIYHMFSHNQILMLNLIQNNLIFSCLLDFFQLYTYHPQTRKKILSPYNCLYLYFYYKSVNDVQNLKQIEELIKSRINMDIDQILQLCQKGENEHYICQLIRQDSIDDFILYINEKNFEINSQIPFSTFEANNFLQNNEITLIEYAAFYGSIQIVKYLLKSGVKIDLSLLEFAVHSRNPEMIHIIEDSLGEDPVKRKILRQNSFFCGLSDIPMNLKKNMKGPVDALIESIKCFQNDFAYYFEQNGCDVNNEDELQNLIIAYGFNHYNYEFIPNDFNLLFPLSRYNEQIYCGIPENAFKVFYTLTEMTIPHSVTKIQDLCFEKLSNLNKVVISSSVTEIGVGSFIGCSSLKEVSLSSSVKSIGDNAFMNCKSLEKVIFDDKSSLESISNYTFANCFALKQISIPSSLKSIGDYAFIKCKSLKKIIFKKNSSLTTIGKNSFDNCTSLTEILIPSSLKLIDESAFKNCKSLSTVSFEDSYSLASICKSSFAYCSSLISLTIPNSVTLIDDHAFENCSSLKQISIPSSVTSIGDCSFSYCTSLVKISIPDSVKSIGKCAFDSCSLLEEVSIPSSLTSIGDYLFENCSSLKQISIPSSVTSIGDYSFFKCTSLSNITIPSSVTSIGDYSFCKCTSLSNVAIPSSVTSIGNHTFEGCSLLKQIEIPSSTKSIGNYSFRNCTSLEKVMISSPATKIGDFAFSGCKSLPKSMIPIDKNESNNQNNKDEIHKYLQNRKELYLNIFDYLESSEEMSDNLLKMIQKIAEDKYDLIELINLLTNLFIEASSTSIIEKIAQILDVCKENIQQKIKYNKLYYMLKRNKKKLAGKKKSNICTIIRNDSIDQFISQLKKMEKKEKNNKFQISNQSIPRSMYETNPLLNQVRYIQYAAFYGATKIFNYLFKKEFIDDDYDDDFFNYTNSMNQFSQRNSYKIQGMKSLWEYAIHGRQQEILHILEQNNIKPSNETVVDQYGHVQQNELNIQNCFEKATKCHENELARNLIKNNKIKTNYLNAIENFNFEFIEDFYNKFEDNIAFLLFNACFYNYPKFAQVLITSKNIDLNEFSNEHTLNTDKYFDYMYNRAEKSDTCNIINAAIKSNNEIIEFIIKTQKNVEFDGSLLVEVMLKNNYELVEIMLSHPNIDVNIISDVDYEYLGETLDHLSPLFLAILQYNIDFIKLLLNHPNIDVNKSFEPNTGRTTYRTALHIAIEMEFIEAIELLLERPDIDVNAIANIDEESFNFQNWGKRNFDFYYTPLHEAVELKNIEIIKLLLAHPKIDVNKIEVIDNYDGKHKCRFDRVKQSVLCRAIQMQDLEIVQLLLQHPGIDVNKKAVFHQNNEDENDIDINEEEEEDINDENEEDHNENEDEQKQKQSHSGFNKFMYNDDDESEIKVRRNPLQFAYAGKSEEIIQLLLNRSDIKKTHAKRKDVLIKMFTRDINDENEEEEDINDENEEEDINDENEDEDIIVENDDDEEEDINESS